MRRRIVVVPHDPEWKHSFEREAEVLQEVFGREIVAIHQVGSTAIPSASAKPIVDMAVEVRNIEVVDAFNDKMMKHGYDPKGEFGISGRRFFVKGGDATRTHHVHIYEEGHREVVQHLAFRDYMNAHPVAAEAYSRLKEELARQFPEDVDGYMAGKDAFIKEMNQRALQWWRRHSDC